MRLASTNDMETRERDEQRTPTSKEVLKNESGCRIRHFRYIIDVNSKINSISTKGNNIEWQDSSGTRRKVVYNEMRMNEYEQEMKEWYGVKGTGFLKPRILQ